MQLKLSNISLDEDKKVLYFHNYSKPYTLKINDRALIKVLLKQHSIDIDSLETPIKDLIDLQKGVDDFWVEEDGSPFSDICIYDDIITPYINHKIMDWCDVGIEDLMDIDYYLVTTTNLLKIFYASENKIVIDLFFKKGKMSISFNPNNENEVLIEANTKYISIDEIEVFESGKGDSFFGHFLSETINPIMNMFFYFKNPINIAAKNLLIQLHKEYLDAV